MGEDDKLKLFALEDYRFFCRQVLRVIYETNGPQAIDRIEQVARAMVAQRHTPPPLSDVQAKCLEMIDADIAAVRSDPDIV